MALLSLRKAHCVVHEWEADSGYRFWTGPFLTREDSFADCSRQEEYGYTFSDSDCIVGCPGCAADRALVTSPKRWLRTTRQEVTS